MPMLVYSDVSPIQFSEPYTQVKKCIRMYLRKATAINHSKRYNKCKASVKVICGVK